MGVVYLALREADGSRVALKTIKPAVAAGDPEVQRFLREAAILADLDHPNIVAFRESGESAGVFHFAMDFVAGATPRGSRRTTEARCRPAARWVWSASCSRRWTTPTPRGSSTATSSRPTCW